MSQPTHVTKVGAYTPRQAVFNILITELYHHFHDTGRDWLADYDDRPSMKRKMKAQIVKFHNKLLEESGLDGIGLDEEDIK